MDCFEWILSQRTASDSYKRRGLYHGSETQEIWRARHPVPSRVRTYSLWEKHACQLALTPRLIKHAYCMIQHSRCILSMHRECFLSFCQIWHSVLFPCLRIKNLCTKTGRKEHKRFTDTKCSIYSSEHLNNTHTIPNRKSASSRDELLNILRI